MAHFFFMLLFISVCQSKIIKFPGRGSCRENEVCTLIGRCPSLLSKALGNKEEDMEELRKSLCDDVNKKRIMVCCPQSRQRFLPIASSLPETPTGENLLPKNCGFPELEDRILGKEEAPLNAYPWMVAIIYRDLFGKEEFGCAASVITSRYLLTAAHCVDPRALGGREIIQLNIGDYDISNPDLDCINHRIGKICSNGPHVEAKPEEIIIHQNYSKRFRDSDDIALIRIDKEIDFLQDKNHITPVCIPKKDFSERSLLQHNEAIATGWGFTENRTTSNILLRVRLPFADRNLCKKLYREIFSDTQICAGGNSGRDTCSGDSGGPLVITTEQGPPFIQIGIVSIGPQTCFLENFPALYTDVAKYRQWIVDNLKP